MVYVLNITDNGININQSLGFKLLLSKMFLTPLSLSRTSSDFRGPSAFKITVVLPAMHCTSNYFYPYFPLNTKSPAGIWG